MAYYGSQQQYGPEPHYGVSPNTCLHCSGGGESGASSCVRPARTDSVPFAGYSHYFPNNPRVNVSSLYDAGGYANFVDLGFLIRPDLKYSNGTRCKYVYNSHNLQPHYGQQYPDRYPPGLQTLNERAWRRDRTRNTVFYPA